MKKNKIMFVLAMLLLSSLVSPAMAATSDFVGVDAGDDMKFNYTLENSTTTTEYEFELVVNSIEDVEGDANVTVTMTTEDEDLQELIDAMEYDDYSFIIFADDIGPIYNETDEEYGEIYLGLWILLLVVMAPDVFIVNSNLEPKVTEHSVNDEGYSEDVYLEYNNDGVLKEFNWEVAEDGETEKLSITQKGFSIPSYPLAIIGLLCVVTLGFIVQKRK